MEIVSVLETVINELKGDSIIEIPSRIPVKIPTLEKNFYRNITPQLLEIYKRISYWEDSTHGDWIAIETMELFWEKTNNPLVCNVKSAMENWDNDIANLFQERRISVFAGSEFTYERVYLVWFDSVVEPEVWVYDVNGESRYKDLITYLKCYLEDDVSSLNQLWHPSLIKE